MVETAQTPSLSTPPPPPPANLRAPGDRRASRSSGGDADGLLPRRSVAGAPPSSTASPGVRLRSRIL